MRLLILCAFLFFLSIAFRIEDKKVLSPESEVLGLDAEEDFIDLGAYAQDEDLIFVQTLPENAFSRVLSLGISVLADLGRGYDLSRLLLFQSNSIQDWGKLFSHSALSVWEEGGRTQFLWVSPYQNQEGLRNLLPEKLRLSVDQKSRWVAWQVLSNQVLYLKRMGSHLLVSSSTARKLPSAENPKVMDEKTNNLFLRVQKGGLSLVSELLALKNPNPLQHLERVEGSVNGESSLTINIYPRNPQLLRSWRGEQANFPRYNAVFQLGFYFSQWLGSTSIKKRITTQVLRRNRLLLAILETLDGSFHFFGNMQGRTPIWAIKLGCLNPGTSGRAVHYLEEFLQSKGGILSSLKPGKSYSLSLPLLPVHLFLSREGKELIFGNTPESWPTEISGKKLYGLGHLQMNLGPIWDQIEKFSTQAKSRYHKARFRECIRKMKSSSMNLDSCPLGPPYLQTAKTPSCVLHGSLADPGMELALEKESRFLILKQALKTLERSDFQVSVNDSAMQLQLTRTP